jgi:hypothetical protein
MSIAAMLAVVVACSAAASLAGSAVHRGPVAKLTARVSPHRKRLQPGTPIAFTLDTRFASDPPGGNFVLRRLAYLFPRSTVVNGRLFPSCGVSVIERAHGRLRACPKGSRIGRGTVSGDAVALGVTSRASLTLFNGPGGRSITMNVRVKTPALINTTVSARLRTLRSRFAHKLTLVAPPVLTNVLDGEIVTTHLHLTIGARRIIHGVKRGYVEAGRCPRSGRARTLGAFTFRRGAKASADATVAC